jgi:hypothetical protein
MSINSDPILVALESIADPVFAPAASLARSAVASGAQVVRSPRAVPVDELTGIYALRLEHADIQKATLFRRLLQVLAEAPGERWFIYSVGFDPVLFAVFASENGAGRACIAFKEG